MQGEDNHTFMVIQCKRGESFKNKLHTIIHETMGNKVLHQADHSLVITSLNRPANSHSLWECLMKFHEVDVLVDCWFWEDLEDKLRENSTDVLDQFVRLLNDKVPNSMDELREALKWLHVVIEKLHNSKFENKEVD